MTRPAWMTRRGINKPHIGRGPSIVTATALPDPGPGTEFGKLVGELGLQPKSGCTCQALMARMNELGVEGCRRERKQLLRELKANYVQYTAADKAWAAYNAIVSGLAFKMNPLRPLPGLFDEAVRRSAATAAGS